MCDGLNPKAELAIFLSNGHTFLFNDVHLYKDDRDALIFSYVSNRTGELKLANFDKRRIAGSSINDFAVPAPAKPW